MIEYFDAQDIIRRRGPSPAGEEQVPLRQALGRILARDVLSDMDIPPFNKSAMDGFAVRAADVAVIPVTLNVIMDVPAGGIPSGPIGRGQTASIMTGAPVPDGADAVVQVEWTSGFGAEQVTIEKGVEPGRNLSPRGEIMKTGRVALRAGAQIGVEEIGLLATVGCDPVPVFKKPTVAVLSTGDEIVPPSVKPGPSQIRDSNGPSLEAYLREMGLDPVNLGQVEDDPESMYRAVGRGLEFDCLLVTGGVSAGAYDFVQDILVRHGVEVHFSRVAIKPGKPAVFGTRGDKMVFGLPGNPVSAIVIARILTGVALAKRMGWTRPPLATIKARLTRDIRKKPGRLWFVPAIVRLDEVVTVEPVVNLGSADLTAASRSNCLVMAPKGMTTVEQDTMVDVVLWERFLCL